MNKEAIAVLKAARALIERRDAWTTEATARDDDGEWITPYSDRAVCWCALGAIERASHSLIARGFQRWNAEMSAQELLSRTIGDSIAEYNDTHTHKQVLSRFDKAIKLAEARP